MRLETRVALVTGGGSGIGRATARRFAAEGAAVVVNDMDEAAATATADLIRQDGGRAEAAPGSVTRASDIAAAVDVALETFGRLDILINNAGITRDALAVRIRDGEVQRLREPDWDAVLDVNLKGTFLCCQEAAIPMIGQGYGRIVNTASVAAYGNVGQANYSASKAGVIGLTRTLAKEWARYGILVNCLAPGAVDTPMTAAIPDKHREQLLQQIPLRRMADPSEIAAAHLFLASDDASYITGQCLVVDAGLLI
jgi:3-oxoacyl-[acyl-carrier protein] reductase